MELGYFNPYHDVTIKQNHLPHWQQRDATYFVTFRMSDSIPKELLDRWIIQREEWTKKHQRMTAELEKEYYMRFPLQIEKWLDCSHGSCALKLKEVRGCVEEVFRNFDGIQYSLYSWVLMPNHVHVLFALQDNYRLERVIGAWKGVSARRINTELNKLGSFWQKDYFDRMIRDEAHFWRCAKYIRDNPVKAELTAESYTLFESEFVKSNLA